MLLLSMMCVSSIFLSEDYWWSKHRGNPSNAVNYNQHGKQIKSIDIGKVEVGLSEGLDVYLTVYVMPARTT